METADLNVPQVMRAPGRLVVNPTDLSIVAFPYGGTFIGLTKMCALLALGESRLVEFEGLGRTGAILRGNNRHAFSCLVRGWSDAAIQRLMANERDDGAQTGRSAVQVPGLHRPGARASLRQVKLLFVPDDVLHVPAVLIYAAVPNWTPGLEMKFQRAEELGLPLTFECMRDTVGRVLQIGRLSDLTL